MLFQIIFFSLLGLLLSFMVIIGLFLFIRSRILAIPSGQYGDSMSYSLREAVESILRYTKSGRGYFIFSILLVMSMWALWAFIAGGNAAASFRVSVTPAETDKAFALILSAIFLFLFFTTNWVTAKFGRESMKLLKKTTSIGTEDQKALVSQLTSSTVYYGIYLVAFSLYLIPIFTIFK